MLVRGANTEAIVGWGAGASMERLPASDIRRSPAGLTRGSMLRFGSRRRVMDCRVEPGNDRWRGFAASASFRALSISSLSPPAAACVARRGRGDREIRETRRDDRAAAILFRRGLSAARYEACPSIPSE